MPDVDEVIARVHRDEWARVVATIARRFGDLDIAEDAAAEAFATALEHWPAHGVPPNPGGWLTTTAGNKALDRLRREGRRDAKQQEAQMLIDQLSGPPNRSAPSTTTGCGCSSPARTPRSRWRRASR